jgi:hypothetical protein
VQHARRLVSCLRIRSSRSAESVLGTRAWESDRDLRFEPDDSVPPCRRVPLSRPLWAGSARGVAGAVVETAGSAWESYAVVVVMESYRYRRLSGGIPLTGDRGAVREEARSNRRPSAGCHPVAAAIDPWMRHAVRRLTVAAGDAIRVRRCAPGVGLAWRSCRLDHPGIRLLAS